MNAIKHSSSIPLIHLFWCLQLLAHFPLFSQAGESLAVAFGGNLKAQQSARTVFALAHRHGDILREGWKNIMDCMLHLFKAKLLPKSLVEVSRPSRSTWGEYLVA